MSEQYLRHFRCVHGHLPWSCPEEVCGYRDRCVENDMDKLLLLESAQTLWEYGERDAERGGEQAAFRIAGHLGFNEGMARLHRWLRKKLDAYEIPRLTETAATDKAMRLEISQAGAYFISRSGARPATPEEIYRFVREVVEEENADQGAGVHLDHAKNES